MKKRLFVVFAALMLTMALTGCGVELTNDLVDTDITGSLEGIYDASEYTTKLIRFEYVGKS